MRILASIMVKKQENGKKKQQNNGPRVVAVSSEPNVYSLMFPGIFHNQPTSPFPLPLVHLPMPAYHITPASWEPV